MVAMSDRSRLALRFVLPAVWLGMLVAIDLLEAPLKFQAPGITIPLGLGIGRLVFTAMNIAECVLAILLGLAMRGPRLGRRPTAVLLSVFGLLLFKVAVLRTVMWGHTDAVLAGESTGGSPVHFLYIAVDAAIFTLLVAFLVLHARRVRLLPAWEGAAPKP